MNRYWENQSGIYDPTATEVIENESKRNKEIHDTISQIKNILIDLYRDWETDRKSVV